VTRLDARGAAMLASGKFYARREYGRKLLCFHKLCVFLIVAAALGLAACSRGLPPPPPEEPVCPDNIQDPVFENGYRSVMGVGDGAYAALYLFLQQPGRFNVVAALNGPTESTALTTSPHPSSVASGLLINNWFDYDPATAAATAALDLLPSYAQSIYLDELQGDPAAVNAPIEALAAVLKGRLGKQSATRIANNCLVSQLQRYDVHDWDTPALTYPLWWPWKYLLFDLPGVSGDFWGAGEAPLTEGRLSQALRFISLRMPNGHYQAGYENPGAWQVRTYYSLTTGGYVQYGIGFPAGYFDQVSSWKTYPVIYFFHDRDGTLDDAAVVYAREADLEQRMLVKQSLLIVFDQVVGDYDALVEELIAYVEANYRVQYEVNNRQ